MLNRKKKEQIYYKEGQIQLLKDYIIFHFKECYLSELDNCYHIIDLYNNKIIIPSKNINYIFYHANNTRNDGIDKIEGNEK